MPIDPFSFKGAVGNPFSEMNRLNKLLSAADPALKLQSAISKMTQFRGAMAGVDLSPLRGAVADHARFAGVHSEHLRLAIQGNEHFKAITAAAGGGASSLRPASCSAHVWTPRVCRIFIPASLSNTRLWKTACVPSAALRIMMPHSDPPSWRIDSGCPGFWMPTGSARTCSPTALRPPD